MPPANHPSPELKFSFLVGSAHIRRAHTAYTTATPFIREPWMGYGVNGGHGGRWGASYVQTVSVG